MAVDSSLLLSALLAAADASTPVSRADLPALLARIDAGWGRRDEQGYLDTIRSQLDAAEKVAPKQYEVLWRQSRLYFWLSDDPTLPDDDKSTLGKKAWDYGDAATEVEPGRVEGWYYAAVGMGNYSLGLGIFKALAQGIESKFRDRLSRAEQLDPAFLDGGVYNAWGRFWFKLPWPKYDRRRSEEALRKALKVNPANLRGRVYLAELYVKEGDSKDAKKLLDEVIAAKPGAYDAPEERRAQALALAVLAGMQQ